MTVEIAWCTETNSHVQQEKTFYPTKIPLAHHQLRHLISCPQSNLIYFVNERDVYCLDTSTHKRSHVAVLPFTPTCTASGHGWFCAGGEERGYFATIRIPSSRTTNQQAHDASSYRPSAIFRNSRSVSLQDNLGSIEQSHPPQIRVERLGELIVNSISIHRFEESDNGYEDDVVALLTNNDGTVRFYSLTQDIELKVEGFNFAVNHATFSPDGKMMVVVGDKDKVYFYSRLDHPPTPKSKNQPEDASFAAHRWELLKKFDLYKPPHNSAVAYFTTAWSPSGNLCAAASEDGFVTVFDVDAIPRSDSGTDAIVAVVPSTRPNTTPGAIRTMCFAPEPWDLLLWTESHGVVCLSDLRSGLTKRQVVHLDPKAEAVHRVGLHDASSVLEDSELRNLQSQVELLRRQRRAISQAEQSIGDVSMLANNGATSVERRRIQQQPGNPEPFDPTLGMTGLTQTEQEILDALRITRQREQAIQNGDLVSPGALPGESRPIPRSINYIHSERNTGQERAARRIREHALLSSMRDMMRERRDSTAQRVRRRASAAQAPNANAANEESTDTGSTDLEAWRTIQDELNRAQELAINIEAIDDDGLDDESPRISSWLFSARRAAGEEPSTTTTANPASRTNASALPTERRPQPSSGLSRATHSRLREQMLRRNGEVSQEASALLRRVNGGAIRVGSDARTMLFPGGEDPDWGSATTGIAWDHSGRVVYVGTEEGIFELKANFDDRKFWPAVKIR